MGFPILVRCHLYIESGPCMQSANSLANYSNKKYFILDVFGSPASNLLSIQVMVWCLPETNPYGEQWLNISLALQYRITLYCCSQIYTFGDNYGDVKNSFGLFWNIEWISDISTYCEWQKFVISCSESTKVDSTWLRSFSVPVKLLSKWPVLCSTSIITQ